MAVFYIIAGIIVIIGNVANMPAGLVHDLQVWHFTPQAVTGGILRYNRCRFNDGGPCSYGIARGCFL